MASSHDTVAHNWAHQTGKAKRGFAMFYEGDTIYSWGNHFPMARILPGGVVLYTTQSYSVSTSKHLSIVRRAVSHLDVIECHDVSAVSEFAHLDNCARMARDYIAKLESSVRRRKASYAEFDLQDAERIAINHARYAKLFKVRKQSKLKPPTDMEAFKATLAEKAKAEREANKAKREAAAERARIEAERIEREDVPEWRTGGRLSLPYTYPKTLMRVINDTVGTSKGAQFPVSDARRAWPLLVHQRRKLCDDVPRVEINATVGNFALDHITAQGVRAGCHFVEWCEVEYIAKELGL